MVGWFLLGIAVLYTRDVYFWAPSSNLCSPPLFPVKYFDWTLKKKHFNRLISPHQHGDKHHVCVLTSIGLSIWVRRPKWLITQFRFWEKRERNTKPSLSEGKKWPRESISVGKHIFPVKMCAFFVFLQCK